MYLPQSGHTARNGETRESAGEASDYSTIMFTLENSDPGSHGSSIGAT